MRVLTSFVSIIAIACFTVLMIIGYVMNIYKITQCDFESPYKAEFFRAVGFVPVVGGILGFIDIEDEKTKGEVK